MSEKKQSPELPDSSHQAEVGSPMREQVEKEGQEGQRCLLTPSPKKPTIVWGVVSSVVFVLGMIIGFLFMPDPNAQGVTDQQLISWLLAYTVIGVLLGGFGQLLRAVAHGATSKAGKKVDGIGKVTSLFGWSLGLPAAVTFAVSRGAPGLLLNVTVLSVFFLAAAVGLYFLIRFLKGTSNPQ